MDYEAHWQTLYNEMRTALDVDYADVAIYHTTSTDDQTGQPADPPYVVYTDETNRSLGTTGGGNSKVLKSGFRITSRHESLSEALGMISAIVTRLDLADSTVTTADGYVTTDMQIIGQQTLFETDSLLYAVHLRIDWERSR